jgi:uncharacterized protein YuzB (UPF0349 family)
LKKLKIRFCQWNIKEEGSEDVMRYQQEHNHDIANVELLRCLGNCSICNQGPYCTVNDFLFQKDTPEQLNDHLNQLLARLRKDLEEQRRKKKEENHDD